MSIYRDGLIPQAETSQSSAMAAYRVGKVDFQTLLSSVLDLQNLRQEYYRSLADHEIAIAKLQQIIGDRDETPVGDSACWHSSWLSHANSLRS